MTRRVRFLSQQSREKDCDGSVREFDYDHGLLTRLLLHFNLTTSRNMERYGTEKPPILDPKRIRIPIKMYYSDGDDLVPVQVNLVPSKDTLKNIICPKNGPFARAERDTFIVKTHAQTRNSPIQEAMKMAEDIGIPAEHMHRIDDDRFSHINYILNQRRHDFVIHAMNFFKGVDTSWPLEIHSTENLGDT